jgi:hypothetical protein
MQDFLQQACIVRTANSDTLQLVINTKAREATLVINTISVSCEHILIAPGNGNDNHLQTIRFQIKDKLLRITLYR